MLDVVLLGMTTWLGGVYTVLGYEVCMAWRLDRRQPIRSYQSKALFPTLMAMRYTSDALPHSPGFTVDSSTSDMVQNIIGSWDNHARLE